MLSGLFCVPNGLDANGITSACVASIVRIVFLAKVYSRVDFTCK